MGLCIVSRDDIGPFCAPGCCDVQHISGGSLRTRRDQIMMVDFFPDTTELQKQRSENQRLARESSADEAQRRTEQQAGPESKANQLRQVREQVINEFYRKMQALGEPFDEAWSRTGRAFGSPAPLDTEAYVIHYRLGESAGSARLAIWVSGHRLFTYIFDEVITDLPHDTRTLAFSERNPGLIESHEWDCLVAAMDERLKGSKN